MDGSDRTVPKTPAGLAANGSGDAGGERSRCDDCDSNEFPDARIIILTTYAGDVRISRALKAGARGYLLKSLLRKELFDTIRAVHAGQKRIPADLATQVADHVADDTLTLREIEVLKAIAAGNANN